MESTDQVPRPPAHPAKNSLDGLLERYDSMSRPTPDPWFSARVCAAIHYREHREKDTLFGVLPLPGIGAIAAVSITLLALAGFLNLDKAAPQHSLVEMGEIGVVADLEILLADAQAELWQNSEFALSTASHLTP